MSQVKIEQGILLQVVKPNFTVDRGHAREQRQTLIEVDDVIMIHHPYAWHFLTMDGEMFVADEAYILEYCEPFGKWIDVFELRGKINVQQIMAWHMYRTQEFEYRLNYSDKFQELRDKAFHIQYEKEAKFMERRAAK